MAGSDGGLSQASGLRALRVRGGGRRLRSSRETLLSRCAGRLAPISARKARPFRFRVTYRLLTIQKRLSIEVRASGTRAGIRMAKAIRSLAGGHGANSNLGNGNLRPETFGENARNCPRETPDRQLRPILIEPSYGNVVLSCAGGNHVGLCRLPGGRCRDRTSGPPLWRLLSAELIARVELTRLVDTLKFALTTRMPWTTWSTFGLSVSARTKDHDPQASPLRPHQRHTSTRNSGKLGDDEGSGCPAWAQSEDGRQMAKSKDDLGCAQGSSAGRTTPRDHLERGRTTFNAADQSVSMIIETGPQICTETTPDRADCLEARRLFRASPLR